jgi:hypothetical protein
MKLFKILGVAAVAAMALMAFAGSASATTLTSPAGSIYTKEIKATAAGTLTLKAGFATITCTESTVAGKPNAQSDTTTVTGNISTLSFGGCNATVTTLTKGSLEIHAIGSGPNGTLTGQGSEVTVSTAGTSCVYGASTGTHLGVLTGSSSTTATMDISAELTKISGGFLCANPAHWEGTYSVTTPDNLVID